ncbi:molecular chaperone DnaJ [Acinetobacter pragensis]|uniref:Molecular chaperone DnaJ n=1 Tax=Acinetobacter pragensis TaxID=1806892 RepID=A0A151XZJ5_9GAMM|nr:molecular chaperone DnaJ [Acinetobacter pragensis]KYQ71243.1 molecular chaperone DnaJ [Acinetobacter pragensis]
MSLDLKISLLPETSQTLSPQHKKLNKLIDQIEQQKQDLALWQNAQTDIQSYIHLKLVPIYADLHGLWFKQMQALWQHLQQEDFSKADTAQIDTKLTKLAQTLKKSKNLNTAQMDLVTEVAQFYAQAKAHSQNKKKKKAKDTQQSFDEASQENTAELEDWQNHDWDAEQWNDVQDNEQYQQQREEHQRKRLQQKREQAERLAEQSLKTVYLKITAMIHPDREPDEAKKIKKTELFQVVSQAYDQQDLFYLLKLQLQLETNKGLSPKVLTDEHLKFYKMALEAQSQKLASQIDDITDSLHWSDRPKAKNMQVKDVYKVIDADVVALKEQVKWEKERLKYMGKVSGVEVLLENNVL